MFKFSKRASKSITKAKKTRLNLDRLNDRINPVITAGFASDATTAWIQVTGDTGLYKAGVPDPTGSPVNTVISVSDTLTGIHVVGTDDAPTGFTGALDAIFDDATFSAFAAGKTITGVHVTTGDGNDLILASGLGGATFSVGHSVSVVAGGGNDLISGSQKNDSIDGGAGNDSITGNGGLDSMAGSAGNDTIVADYADFILPPSISGGTGNDVLWMDGTGPSSPPTSPGKASFVNVDFETINGGNGNDTIDSSGVSFPVTINGNDGNDSITGGSGNDSLSGGAGNDTVSGGAGNDSIDGGTGNDSLIGGAGNDSITGGTGDDTVQGGAGSDTLSGGVGNDTLDYSDDTSTGLFVVLGGASPGNPAFTTVTQGPTGSSAIGDSADNTFENLNGGTGDDFLMGNNGANSINGGAGNDQIYGLDGNDSLTGGTGNDTMNGGNGADMMDGGAGEDTMNGGDGDDTMVGGAGNDALQGDNGNDTIFGDESSFMTRTTVPLTNNLPPASFPFLHQMSGPNGPLAATTNNPNGNDTLQGNNGSDVLDGGLGADIADGGLGMDTFILYATPTTSYSSTIGAGLLDPGDQYFGGAGADTFKVVHAWDVYQLTDGPAGVTVKVGNVDRQNAASTYLNSLQALATPQTDYDARIDTLTYDTGMN